MLGGDGHLAVRNGLAADGVRLVCCPYAGLTASQKPDRNICNNVIWGCPAG